MASQVNCLCNPPIALIITESKARVVFFPFQSRHDVFADAIVTDAFDLFAPCGNVTNFDAFVAFVARYIKADTFKCIERSRAHLTKKGTYANSLVPYHEVTRSLNAKLKDKLLKERAKKEQAVAEMEQAVAEMEQAVAEKEQERAEKEQAVATIAKLKRLLAEQEKQIVLFTPSKK